MSCDASYVLVRGGFERCFYNRVGGYSLPGMLLEGPDRFVAYVAEQLETNDFEIDTFFGGVAIVDLDRRDLFWWCGGFSSAAWRRMFDALLARIWPRWHIHTTMLAEDVLAPRSPRGQRLLTFERQSITAYEALSRNMERFLAA